MIRLIGNELYKILHKKLLYIVLILAIGFTILIGVVNKIMYKDDYDATIQLNTIYVDTFEKSNDTSSSEYINYKTELEMAKLKKEKGFTKESPEAYYIDRYVSANYSQYLRVSKDSEATPEMKQEAKDKLDEMMNKIGSFDWKQLVREEINDLLVNQEYCEFDSQAKCDAINKEKKRVLEYRLNHNIPYSNNDASNTLVDYIQTYGDYYDVKDVDNNKLTYEQILNKRNLEKTYMKGKYLIDNEKLTNDYSEYNTGSTFADNFLVPSFMVVIVLLALSASTVAEEFNKGTIKQLLVKPYSRIKIVLSKMIAVIFITIVMLFIINISTTIIEGLFDGDLKTVLGSTIIYDFNTQNCIEMSYIKYALLTFVYMLPEIILLSLFVFSMSVIFTNTAFALGMGFGAYVSETIFPLFLEKFKFISYIPTLNYNFTTYMFGGINSYEELTLTKAITVSSISFVVLFILILIVFKNKDIKNQ